MKIICVGRNYQNHVLELNNTTPTEILFFLKPETAIPSKGQPFFIPDFSKEIHHEVELIIKINKTGKHIDEKFAHNYYDEISLGIDFTARDIQKKAKNKREPWEKAKAFDGSAPLGVFLKKEGFNMQNIKFELHINNTSVQKGNTKNMIFSINQIISYVSKFITLKKGDIIFTGTPSGVGKVKKNDVLEAFIENNKVLEIKIK